VELGYIERNNLKVKKKLLAGEVVEQDANQINLTCLKTKKF